MEFRAANRQGRALLVVGKAPEPGRTKTRLCPPLTPAGAARLSAAFLRDVLAIGCTLGWEHVAVVYPPDDGAQATLADLVPPGVALWPQPETGLGGALSTAFAHHLQLFERVVLIGSDNPTLPAVIVAEACRKLDESDVVIGPSTDGGYYLLGLRSPQPRLFERITWSTSEVYPETLMRARDANLTVAALPEWYDVDTGAELDRLRAELRLLPATSAPATRSTLAQLTLA